EGGQRCRGQDEVRGVGVEAAQALGQGVVEGAEGAGAVQRIQEGGLGHGLPSPWPASRAGPSPASGRGEFLGAPANSSSSACTRSGGKVWAKMPGVLSPVGASRDRKST